MIIQGPCAWLAAAQAHQTYANSLTLLLERTESLSHQVRLNVQQHACELMPQRSCSSWHDVGIYSLRASMEGVRTGTKVLVWFTQTVVSDSPVEACMFQRQASMYENEEHTCSCNKYALLRFMQTIQCSVSLIAPHWWYSWELLHFMIQGQDTLHNVRWHRHTRMCTEIRT